jgi:hypothetical protein
LVPGSYYGTTSASLYPKMAGSFGAEGVSIARWSAGSVSGGGSVEQASTDCCSGLLSAVAAAW